MLSQEQRARRSTMSSASDSTSPRSTTSSNSSRQSYSSLLGNKPKHPWTVVPSKAPLFPSDNNKASSFSTVATKETINIPQKPLLETPNMESLTLGMSRPPSRRVDLGDDEPSLQLRPPPAIHRTTAVVTPNETVEPVTSTKETTATTTCRSPDFTYLMGNESIISYTSHSTWDELDMMSCSHSIGTCTTVSGRRPPPPTFHNSRNASGRNNNHTTSGGGSSFAGGSGNDSYRSFASFSTRGELDSLYGGASVATTTSTTAASISSRHKQSHHGHHRSPPSHNHTQRSPHRSSTEITMPPFLLRNTTQSSAALLERQDSLKTLNSTTTAGRSSPGMHTTTTPTTSPSHKKNNSPPQHHNGHSARRHDSNPRHGGARRHDNLERMVIRTKTRVPVTQSMASNHDNNKQDHRAEPSTSYASTNKTTSNNKVTAERSSYASSSKTASAFAPPPRSHVPVSHEPKPEAFANEVAAKADQDNHDKKMPSKEDLVVAMERQLETQQQQPASWQPKGFSFRPFRRASM